jgi:RNA polymerase sigma-70 factor, ECF subfamily
MLTSVAAPAESRRQEPVASDRDQEARFREMVDLHHAFVWRVLRGLGVSSAEADDAAQKVFLTAAGKMALIELGAERAFLYRVAAGVAANARRSRSRSKEVACDSQQLAAHPDSTQNPEQAVAMKQARALLDEALETMSDDVRGVFVLFELEELSVPEIATILDLPTGTAASRLRRAREEFAAFTKRLHASGGRR